MDALAEEKKKLISWKRNDCISSLFHDSCNKCFESGVAWISDHTRLTLENFPAETVNPKVASHLNANMGPS